MIRATAVFMFAVAATLLAVASFVRERTPHAPPTPPAARTVELDFQSFEIPLDPSPPPAEPTEAAAVPEPPVPAPADVSAPAASETLPAAALDSSQLVRRMLRLYRRNSGGE